MWFGVCVWPLMDEFYLIWMINGLDGWIMDVGCCLEFVVVDWMGCGEFQEGIGNSMKVPDGNKGENPFGYVVSRPLVNHLMGDPNRGSVSESTGDPGGRCCFDHCLR